MADFEKNDTRNAKRTASKMQKRQLRISNKGAVEFNKQSKADLKSGKSKTQVKVTSSTMRTAKTNSAKKIGVANKLKTQGKISTQSGRGYSRAGKK